MTVMTDNIIINLYFIWYWKLQVVEMTFNVTLTNDTRMWDNFELPQSSRNLKAIEKYRRIIFNDDAYCYIVLSYFNILCPELHVSSVI